MSQWSAQPFFLLHCGLFSVQWKEAAASLQSKPKSQYQALFSTEMLWRFVDFRVSLRPGWENSHLLKEQEKSGVFLLSSIICGGRSVCKYVCLKTEWGEMPQIVLCLWDSSVMSERAVLGSSSTAGSLGFSNTRKSVFSTPTWWFLCCCDSKAGWKLASETGKQGVLQWKKQGSD